MVGDPLPHHLAVESMGPMGVVRPGWVTWWVAGTFLQGVIIVWHSLGLRMLCKSEETFSHWLQPCTQVDGRLVLVCVQRLMSWHVFHAAVVMTHARDPLLVSSSHDPANAVWIDVEVISSCLIVERVAFVSSEPHLPISEDCVRSAVITLPLSLRHHLVPCI